MAAVRLHCIALHSIALHCIALHCVHLGAVRCGRSVCLEVHSGGPRPFEWYAAAESVHEFTHWSETCPTNRAQSRIMPLTVRTVAVACRACRSDLQCRHSQQVLFIGGLTRCCRSHWRAQVVYDLGAQLRGSRVPTRYVTHRYNCGFRADHRLAQRPLNGDSTHQRANPFGLGAARLPTGHNCHCVPLQAPTAATCSLSFGLHRSSA